MTGSSDLYSLPGLYYTQSDVCILAMDMHACSASMRSTFVQSQQELLLWIPLKAKPLKLLAGLQ